MASNYPTTLDSFSAVTGTMAGTPTHSTRHTSLQDAIAAVQTALGTSPAGAAATVRQRLEAIEANDWVTSARIAANAVGSSELADNAVDTAALQDSAVTTGKIADGTIVDADINAAAAIAQTKVSGLVADLAALAAKATIGNLLPTANVADATNTSATTTGFSVGAATGESSTEQAWVGTRSLKITRTSSNPSVYIQSGTGTSATPISAQAGPMTVWTVVYNPQATSQTVYVGQTFYDAAGTFFGGANLSTVTLAPGAWTIAAWTTTAPATARYIHHRFISASIAVSEVLYFGAFAVFRGAGGRWAMPGVPITGLGTRANPSNAAQVQVWNPGNDTWITV